MEILTLNSQMDALANRWRNTVGCHAEIGRHMESAHFGDVQQLAIDDIDCVGESALRRWIACRDCDCDCEMRGCLLTVLSANQHFLAVLPSPHDIGLRIAARLAHQRHILPLSDDHVIAGHALDYHGWHCVDKESVMCLAVQLSAHGSANLLTHHLQVALPRTHRILQRTTSTNQFNFFSL